MRRIHKVLKALRREGFIARWNYMCCRSCGGAAIAQDAEEIIDKGRPAPAGCVFNSKQDVQHQGKQILIGFGRIYTARHGAVGMSTLRVGRRLAAALDAEGIPFEWDGKADTRITVDAATVLGEVK